MSRITGLSVCFAALALAANASAAVLIFERSPQFVNSEAIPQAYGDRITAISMPAGPPATSFLYGAAGGFTPNIVVQYDGLTASDDIRYWDNNYGDLTHVAWGFTGETTFGLTLTADAGFSAILTSFDLAGWSNADYTIDAVRVYGTGNVLLFSQSDVLVQGNFDGPRRTTFDFGPGLVSSVLRLEIDADRLGTASVNIGLDNVQFSQTPEPATIVTWSALACCGLAFGARRRRGRVA